MWRQRSLQRIARSIPDIASAPPDTRRMIRNKRYCWLLSKRNDLPLDEPSIDCAWKVLRHEMALVPGGKIRRTQETIRVDSLGHGILLHQNQVSEVKPIYMDRTCVTNADYAKFVQTDGYANPDFWPENILNNVLQFTDRTGQPGPKYWADGEPPSNKLDHPVVGVNWYEANAYATWAGKRLPSSDEWQRSGTWALGNSGNSPESRYPWGDSFDPVRANIWSSGMGDTSPVGSYSRGDTPNGINQLIGNVWEWANTQFYPKCEEGVSLKLTQLMAEIRGGAYDTYFPTQASCQFRSGQPLLHRSANVGFRCCISSDAVRDCLDSGSTH